MKNIFLLDMDDTLLDFGRAERANLECTLAAFGVRADGDVLARFHRINDDLWKALERGETTRERLKLARFEQLAEEYGFRADIPALAALYFENFVRFCFPYEGASQFVKELSRQGRVYLVTNGSSKIQRAHIADAGFAPYLSGAFISEEMGADKPSKGYADMVKRGIPQFTQDAAVLFGDSLTSDMGCADAMGVDFVLFAPHGTPASYRGSAAASYKDFLALVSH